MAAEGHLAVLDARIDALRDSMAELLEAVVAIDSSPASLAARGERAVNRLLEERYRAAGLDTAWLGPDPGRPDLVATRTGRGGGRSLALNGHVDTLAPLDAEAWQGDPWRADTGAGRIGGLGSVDGKAAGVVMWAVAQALHDEDVQLAGDLELHSVVGGASAEHELGTSAVLDAGHATDAAIALAPTMRSGRLVVAPVAAGTMRVRVDVLGKVTHCGNRPRAIRPGGQGDAIGVNALEKGLAMLDALAVLEDRWGITKSHPRFEPGAFTIGVQTFRSDAGFAFPAYFPDQATMELHVTYPPGQEPASISGEIEAHLRASSAADPWLVEHPVRVEGVAVRPPLDHDPGHELEGTLGAALAAALRSVQGPDGGPDAPGPPDAPGQPDVPGQPDEPDEPDHMGLPASLVGSSDAAFYAQRGIPAVCFGPGDPLAARRPDESVAVDDLSLAARVLLRAVVAWCGQDGA